MFLIEIYKDITWTEFTSTIFFIQKSTKHFFIHWTQSQDYSLQVCWYIKKYERKLQEIAFIKGLQSSHFLISKLQLLDWRCLTIELSHLIVGRIYFQFQWCWKKVWLPHKVCPSFHSKVGVMNVVSISTTVWLTASSVAVSASPLLRSWYLGPSFSVFFLRKYLSYIFFARAHKINRMLSAK